MPAKFDACVSGGGRVRTKKVSGGKYMHLCFPKGGGPGVAGEVKTKKSSDTNTPDGRVYRKT